MKKILLGIGILFPVFALATTFPSSGIDFDSSSITISGPSGASCLNAPLPETFSLSAMGFDAQEVLDLFGNWTDVSKRCLQMAGTYTMEIEVLDKAGNATSSTRTFTITSDTPDQTESEFSVTCNDAIANNVDACAVELQLRDQFRNDVKQELSNITLVPTSLSKYPDDANEETHFRAGLRIDGSSLGAIPPFTWNIAHPFSASLTAIAPSIIQVETGIENRYVASVVQRPVGFTLANIPEIETSGIPSGTITTSFPNLPMNLTFNVPIEITPGFSNPNVAFGESVTINSKLERRGELPSNTVSSTLESISTHIFSEDSELTYDEFGVITNAEPLNETFTFFPVTTPDEKSVIRYIFEENGGVDDVPENISLVTDAAYGINGLPVRYPAGAIGQEIADAIIDEGYEPEDIVGFNEVNVELKIIGISIEGIVIGDLDQMYLVGGDKNKMTSLSSLHDVDIREKIIKNAYRLIRNAKEVQTTAAGFEWNLFDNKNVVVVDFSGKDLADSTLTLDGGTFPIGKKTLIVLNGNVHFTGDYTYTDKTTDSFGLILLRDQAGPEPERGNIFVHSDVQRLSGTLFADGGFFNGNSTDLLIANAETRDKQLLLTGSLLSRNTIGGARRKDGLYFTPWEETETKDIAKRYDLHQLRRYDSTKTDFMDKCVINEDTLDCDRNIAAFILRQDQKSTLLPPPGFLTD